jgi:hypothetical protein
MVNLNGHEAGNGGYSQGTPTARRAFLYSEKLFAKVVFMFIKGNPTSKNQGLIIGSSWL